MASLFKKPPSCMDLPSSNPSTPTSAQPGPLDLAASPGSSMELGCSPGGAGSPPVTELAAPPPQANMDALESPVKKLRMPLLSMDEITSLTRRRAGDIRRVAFVGNYLPRKCGIATFTHDLRCGFADHFPRISAHVYAVTDAPDAYAYDREVRFEFYEKDPNSYLRLVDMVEANRVDVVCVQHEYGIYGGDCGEMLLTFLKHVKVPVVSTLHTILENPNPQQRRIMRAILRLSSRVVTMTAKGLELLQKVFQGDPERIDVVPHGIPNFTFQEPDAMKGALDLQGHRVILTFGLLSPNKGIEYMIRALPAVVKQYPDTLYVLLGQTHPHLIKERGEEYRHSLQWLANDLGVAQNVRMVNRFVDLDLLKEYIAACDAYVTPYLHEAQITSGTLSYAFGMGTAVVSTPYWHAVDLLSDGKGMLVPFRDPDALATSLLEVLGDDAKRLAMRKEAFRIGRSMTWDAVAELYLSSFQKAKSQPPRECTNDDDLTMSLTAPAATASPVIALDAELPELKLGHLLRMSDDTGLIQFSVFDIPDYDSGYCTDDNARSLTLAVKVLEVHRRGKQLSVPIKSVERAAGTYLAFIRYAFDRTKGRFRNFLSFSRQWVDPDGIGSEESHGRAMQCLGHCCQFGFHTEVAKRLFLDAIPVVYTMSSPRTYAHVIDGAYSYLAAFPEDAPVVELVRFAADQLLRLYRDQAVKTFAAADGPWMWFEPYLTYSNSSLPMAMILAGQITRDPAYTEVGNESLRWVYDLQLHSLPHQVVFSPIGCVASQLRGESITHPQHDQQPIEGSTTVLATIAAFRASPQNPYWLSAAQIAAQWFMGRNFLGLTLYDPQSGGCKDGLHPTGVNDNQGAESTLSFLLVLVEFLLLETEQK